MTLPVTLPGTSPFPALNSPQILIRRQDYLKLSEILENMDSELATHLDEEISRATIIDDHEVPQDLVTMGSTVRFADVESKEESEITLVFPSETRSQENCVSVLAPIGAALLGLKVGQSIDWPLPRGRIKKLRVLSVH